MSVFASPRRFRLWQYSVGHRQLLLRSTKDHAASKRVDVLFKPTWYVALPTDMSHLEITARRATDRPPNVGVGTIPDGLTVFEVRTKTPDAVGHVIAGTLAWHEDDGEDNDPSWFPLPRVVW